MNELNQETQSTESKSKTKYPDLSPSHPKRIEEMKSNNLERQIRRCSQDIPNSIQKGCDEVSKWTTEDEVVAETLQRATSALQDYMQVISGVGTGLLTSLNTSDKLALIETRTSQGYNAVRYNEGDLVQVVKGKQKEFRMSGPSYTITEVVAKDTKKGTSYKYWVCPTGSEDNEDSYRGPYVGNIFTRAASNDDSAQSTEDSFTV